MDGSRDNAAEGAAQSFQLLIDEIRGLREESKTQVNELKQKIEDSNQSTRNEIRGLKEELARQENKFAGAWKQTNERIGVLESKIKDLNVEAIAKTWEEKLTGVETRVANLTTSELSRELDSKIVKLQELAEKHENDLRRNNVVIRGIPTNDPVTAKGVEDYLGDTFRVRCHVTWAKRVGPVTVVAELDSAAAKAEIMRMKSTVLKDTEVYIDHDLTPEARAREKSIRSFVKEERNKGSTVRSDGQRVKVNEVWWRWCRTKKAMVPSNSGKNARKTRNVRKTRGAQGGSGAEEAAPESDQGN